MHISLFGLGRAICELCQHLSLVGRAHAGEKHRQRLICLTNRAGGEKSRHVRLDTALYLFLLNQMQIVWSDIKKSLWLLHTSHRQTLTTINIHNRNEFNCVFNINYFVLYYIFIFILYFLTKMSQVLKGTWYVWNCVL